MFVWSESFRLRSFLSYDTVIMWVDSGVREEHAASVVMVTESRVRNAA
jgi:hypothetical protein